jgi:hypothetical protein
MNSLRKGNLYSKYNKEPVFYCKRCLSLNIRNVPVLEDSCYCDKCGSTSIIESSLEDWESVYMSRFGHSFLEEY